MQKIAPHPTFLHATSLRRAMVASVTMLTLAGVAGHALAECDEDQEAIAGKAIATAATTKVNPVVTIQGKQMVSIDLCDASSAGLVVTFKYNFLGADGLYWVQGSARVRGAEVADLKITQMSPNMAAASTAKGIKLAAN